MARKPGTRTVGEFVLFDVFYEDGAQRSNRRVPGWRSAVSKAMNPPEPSSKNRRGDRGKVRRTAQPDQERSSPGTKETQAELYRSQRGQR